MTAKCPKCEQEIDYLDTCCVGNWRVVALADFAGGDPFLDWSSKVPFSSKVQ
jgi:hypothetical protein